MRLMTLGVTASAAMAVALSLAVARPAPPICGETIAFLDEDDPAAQMPDPNDGASGSLGQNLASQEVPLMGCLPDEQPLRDADIAGAEQAVALEAEPESIGAIFRFAADAQRRRLIADWIRRWAPQSVENQPTSDGVIGAWVNRMWRLPDGSAVNAIYLENKASGRLCLVRGNIAVSKTSLAALNNWCADRLGWWRKR